MSIERAREILRRAATPASSTVEPGVFVSVEIEDLLHITHRHLLWRRLSSALVQQPSAHEIVSTNPTFPPPAKAARAEIYLPHSPPQITAPEKPPQMRCIRDEPLPHAARCRSSSARPQADLRSFALRALNEESTAAFPDAWSGQDRPRPNRFDPDGIPYNSGYALLRSQGTTRGFVDAAFFPALLGEYDHAADSASVGMAF